MMKRKTYLFFILISFFIVFQLPTVVFASNGDNDIEAGMEDNFPGHSPWLEDYDNSIYENPIDAKEDPVDVEPEDPGFVEKSISELIRNIASSFLDLLKTSLNASLDTIIYGRVGSGHPNSVNIYAFELRNGNPYGVTGSVCYSLIRSMCYIFMGVMFVYLLAKSAWGGRTSRTREEIKNYFSNMLFKFISFALMPYFLDVALYVRDVVLYGIKNITSQMITGGATLNISEVFLQRAEASGTFIDAVMYLGTVILTGYFIFIYIAVALDLMICMVAYPGINMFPKGKEITSQLLKAILGDIITPVIDAVLLLIPLLTSLMLSNVIKGVAIIQLVMCMLIIPSRARVKGLLGVQNYAERNGIMGLLGAAALGRTIGKKVKSGIEQIGDVAKDVKNSHMYGSLADVDREEQENLMSTYQPQTEEKNKFDSESTWNEIEDEEEENQFAEEEVEENTEEEVTEEPMEENAEKEGEFASGSMEEESNIPLVKDVNPITSENNFAKNYDNVSSKQKAEEGSSLVEENSSGSQQELHKDREDSQEIYSEKAKEQEIEGVTASIPSEYEDSEQVELIQDSQNPNSHNKEESQVSEEAYQNLDRNRSDASLEDEKAEELMTSQEEHERILSQDMGQVTEQAEKESSDVSILEEDANRTEPLEKSSNDKIARKNDAEQNNIEEQETKTGGYEVRSPADVVKKLERDLASQDTNQNRLKQKKAGLQLRNQEIKRELLDEEKGSPEYAALEKEQADIGIQMAKIDQQIQTGNQQKKELQDKLDDAKQVHGQNGDYDQRRAEILAKHANVNNFEMPEFQKVLTNEERERLYKQRAIRNGAKVIAKTGTAVGTGVLLGSAGVFVPNMGVRMATAGIEVGDYAADKVVDVIGSAKDSSVQVVHSGKDTGTNERSSLKTDNINRNQVNGKESVQPVQTTGTKSQVTHETVKNTESSKKETFNHIEQEVKQPVINQTAEKEKSNDRMDKKELSEQTYKHLQNELVSAFNENGTVASSLALKAIQEANIKADKYFASCKEKNQILSAEEMQEKRIELQTNQLAEQLFSKLNLEEEDAKEGEKAKAILKEKIKKIIARKNKGIYED